MTHKIFLSTGRARGDHLTEEPPPSHPDEDCPATPLNMSSLQALLSTTSAASLIKDINTNPQLIRELASSSKLMSNFSNNTFIRNTDSNFINTLSNSSTESNLRSSLLVKCEDQRNLGQTLPNLVRQDNMAGDSSGITLSSLLGGIRKRERLEVPYARRNTSNKEDVYESDEGNSSLPTDLSMNIRRAVP